MTKIIGLTGGIGSGKTTVANFFEEMGIPVYISDREAKELMNLPEIIVKIKQKFGNEFVTDHGLDRQKLAEKVFKYPQKLKELNAIIHPLVEAHFKQWIKEKKNFPFLIKEAAILFETGNDKNCSKIITVTAPLIYKIERILKRDCTQKKLILEKINSQWTDQIKVYKSDYLIENIDFDQTKKKIFFLLKNLEF
jgi:dephospho-CoA kinase